MGWVFELETPLNYKSLMSELNGFGFGVNPKNPLNY